MKKKTGRPTLKTKLKRLQDGDDVEITVKLKGTITTTGCDAFNLDDDGGEEHLFGHREVVAMKVMPNTYIERESDSTSLSGYTIKVVGKGLRAGCRVITPMQTKQLLRFAAKWVKKPTDTQLNDLPDFHIKANRERMGFYNNDMSTEYSSIVVEGVQELLKRAKKLGLRW